MRKYLWKDKNKVSDDHNKNKVAKDTGKNMKTYLMLIKRKYLNPQYHLLSSRELKHRATNQPHDNTDLY